jgi:hypothetical protein
VGWPSAANVDDGRRLGAVAGRSGGSGFGMGQAAGAGRSGVRHVAGADQSSAG